MRMMHAPPDQAGEQQFYTISEAARLLQVSQATVWRWIQADRLPAYRVGPRRIRIRQEDLRTVIRPASQGRASAHERGRVHALWADYDPQQARQALVASAGALAGIDRDLLMADLRAQREQDSHGRPA